MNKLKIGSCFTGIGAWEKAFEYLGIEYDLKFFCEFDKYPIKSYIEMFNEDEGKNLGDITKSNIDNLPDIDTFCYSPPCQAFSIAGNQLGFKDKRGILFFESLRIIKAKKPKYCLMENVKGLTTKKFNAEFKEMLKALENEGYKNYWKILNTKDYGLPQNRERVFVISIRNDIEQEFEFPIGFDNGIRLKDILESEVNEKYYIAQEKCDKLIQQFKESGRKTLNLNPSGNGMNGIVRNDEIAATVTTNKGEGQKIVIPCITPDRVEKRQNGRRFKEDGEPMFTLTSQDRHEILELGKLNSNRHSSAQNSILSTNGIYTAIDTMQGGNRQPKVLIQQPKYRIRKLTPKECWRLQGFKDSDFEKAAKVNSNSQLYKQAGNSISVNVLIEIYKILFKNYIKEV